ncbi:hypothetical protein SLA2020_420900 [Shorea laevis]
MGFDGLWIRLIMKCITSVSYSILINGDPYGSIILARGLRQGDPISPYLFIICAEALSAMLQEAERSREVTGVPIAKGRSSYDHLIEEARSHLNGMYTGRVNHVCRHLNGVAHYLAKEVLSLTDELTHIGETSQCITDIIL